MSISNNTQTNSIVSFLRKLYTDDALISNERVLALIRIRFPKTKTGPRTINVWKALLRKEGVKIPLQRCYRKMQGSETEKT